MENHPIQVPAFFLAVIVLNDSYRLEAVAVEEMSILSLKKVATTLQLAPQSDSAVG